MLSSHKLLLHFIQFRIDLQFIYPALPSNLSKLKSVLPISCLELKVLWIQYGLINNLVYRRSPKPFIYSHMNANSNDYHYYIKDKTITSLWLHCKSICWKPNIVHNNIWQWESKLQRKPLHRCCTSAPWKFFYENCMQFVAAFTY